MMVGFDEKGNRAYDTWVIRKVVDDRVLQPGVVDKKTFTIAVPKGTTAMELDASLSYIVVPEAQPVLMGKVSKSLQIR